MNPDFSSYNCHIQSGNHYDLIVCGGGPSGVPAALSAARAGLSVLLIESSGQLGGMGTAAGVSHLLGARFNDNSGWCVAGILAEVVDDLAKRGGCLHPENISIAEDKRYSPHGWTGRRSNLTYGVPFDPIQMTILLDDKLLAAGVDVLFFSNVIGVQCQEERINEVLVQNKSGLTAYPCTAVIDATGDADVAKQAGCVVTKGRDADHLMTPATLIFHADNVDTQALSEHIEASGENRFLQHIKLLREQGIWQWDYDRLITVALNEANTYMINTSRLIAVDGTDARSLSRAMMRGRKDVHDLFAVMKEHFPGFAEARIRMVAPRLGVRETRRIIGHYRLSIDDVRLGLDRDDIIGYSSYGWDLPNPKHPSVQDMEKVKKRAITPIPYACLIPEPIDNLLCVGRCISVEREVLGPLREQGPCYAMGQAAGQAALQLKAGRARFADICVKRLRQELSEAGAVVDLPEASLRSGSLHQAKHKPAAV